MPNYFKMANQSDCFKYQDHQASSTCYQSATVVTCDVGSLLHALVSVFHPDWLIRSILQLRRSDDLH